MPPEPCVVCNGQDWVYKNVPFGDPDFGKAFPCRACDGSESPAERAARLWRLSGVSDREQVTYTFDRFDLTLNPNLDLAYHAAAQWAAGGGPPWLMLAAPVGRGKSHLAVAAAHVCILRSEAVAYHVVPTFLDDLRDTLRPYVEGMAPPRTLAQVRRKAERYPAVILDDLGANKRSEWADEQLFSVLNERYREGRRTLITTNENPDAFPERLRSRFMDSQMSRVVCATGRDVRREPR